MPFVYFAKKRYIAELLSECLHLCLLPLLCLNWWPSAVR